MIDNHLILRAENNLKDKFAYFEEIAQFNQEKVLKAFQKQRIALRHFQGSSGYGYGDDGRDTLNLLLADVFKAEKAVCSPNIVSGTHALTLCLYGVLRPNNRVLCVTGQPYDTLTDVINGEGNGSLKDFGISFDCISLTEDNQIDFKAIKKHFDKNGQPEMIYLQRSRGYAWREALSIDNIKNAVVFIKSLGFEGCIMLDNCYGEFLDKLEPTEVGVNLLAGSMIKNIGGGIAPTGGYVVGDEKYVDMVLSRFTSPSIGGEVGSYAFGYQYFYQGLFIAPHVVLQAVKGSLLIGETMRLLGYDVSPTDKQLPGDIIVAIKFGDKEKLISFIQSVQKNSPVDSYVAVLPWEMPGYEVQVIMAAGCFVQGASIEMSADAPIKPPYIAYLQGGLTYEHCKAVLKNLKL